MIDSILFTNQSLIVVLGWVILHSIWQITIIALVLKILLKWTSRYPATVRYTLGLLALLIATVWSGHTFTEEWSQRNVFSYSIESIASENLAEPMILNNAVGNPLISYYKTGLSSITSLVEPVLPYLAIIWILGLFFFTSRIVVGLRRLKHFSKEGIHFFPDKWKTRIKVLKVMSGIHRNIEVRLSELVPVPITYQFFRPIILLPVSVFTGLTDEQIEVLLLHELAHIKRHDYTANLLQSMVEVLFFYHPFIWWISKQIRLEREHCCDDRVMKLRHQPMLYAQTLTQIQAQHFSLKTKLAMSATGNKGEFKQRIFRLFQDQAPTANLRGSFAALMLLFLSGVVMAFYPSTPSIRSSEGTNTQLLVQDTIPKIKLPLTDNEREKLPLIVIDDQAQQKAKSREISKTIFEQYPQEDIDAFIVVKDTDLTSKYGPAAADGVVFVYTKKGPKEGQRFVDTLNKKLDYKSKKLNKAKAQKKKLKHKSNASTKTEDQVAQLKKEKLAYKQAKQQELLQKDLEKAEKIYREKLKKQKLLKKELELKESSILLEKNEKSAYKQAKQQELLQKDLEEAEKMYREKLNKLELLKEQHKLIESSILLEKAERLFQEKSNNASSFDSKQTQKKHLEEKKEEPLYPLFILDGEKLPKREAGKAYLEQINPNDIQSINVIKGNAAIEKYGNEGTNGVVEIFTKSKDKKRKKKAKKRKQMKADKMKLDQIEKKASQPVIADIEPLPAIHPALSIFPNPSDQLANIQVNLAEKGLVKVDIYNIKGQLIKNIANTTLDKGMHQYEWDTRNQPSGTYFVHFNLDGKLISKLLLKK